MTLGAAFRAQAAACQALHSPFMARLLNLLADNWPAGPVDRYLQGFSGDIGPGGASLPLRLAGGLHALVLGGDCPQLANVYPPHAADDAQLVAALLHALDRHADGLIAWAQSPPQTNEVRRSAALIAGAHVATARFDLPIHLSELGASAGLNLLWDHYALRVGPQQFGPEDPALTLSPDWIGPPPPRTKAQIASRRGVDLSPIDATTPKGRLRLLAYLWPDQPQRLALTRSAASLPAPRVDQGDAIDWLQQRLDTAPTGHLHLIQHSIAWQYFPQEAQDHGRAMITAAGDKATDDRPLAWLSLEAAPPAHAPGAALTLRLWPGNITLPLGRADFHGRWIHWNGNIA